MPRTALQTHERTRVGAYIRSGCRLFYVLGMDDLGRVQLEDCYLLTVDLVLAAMVCDDDHYELVRPA